MSIQRVFELLVVEDSSAEARLLAEAWQMSRAKRAHLVSLREPRRILAYLRREPPYEQVPEPDLVLLDYRMPFDGGRILELIRSDPRTTHIPVLVITGVEDPDTLLSIYSRHANCCLKKPETLDGYIELVEEVSRHWLERAQLPPRRSDEFLTPLSPQE